VILFAPAYDEPTRCTHLLALEFERNATQPLLGAAANRANLHGALAYSDDPVVAFAHGSEDHLRGYHGEPVLTVEDARTMSAKAVLAFACHTGTKLGGAMSRTGNAWWGYSGAIAAPPESATESGLIVPVFEFLIEGFLRLRDDVPMPEFFDRLNKRCERASHQFDELFDSGEYVDPGTYLCLLHIWDRLRVWSPGAGRPVYHPRCQSEVALLG
jgi:hypothetical protein